MNTQELLQSGGRIVRQRKGRRVITIAYRRDGNVIEYGATIFRRENPNDHWTKAGQRQIAIDRLESRPVRVEVPDEFDHLGQQDHFVRKCLVDHGCEAD